MNIPFTREQFFDVFASYNTALWPFAVVLWVVSFIIVGQLFRSGRPQCRSVAALLAVHWAWSGVAYHLVFFTDINPAAWLFGSLFLIQSALVAWIGVARRRLRFEWRSTPRAWLAIAVVAYGLLYPFVVAMSGHRYPAMPTFGVPCPTTILTIGLLLMTASPLRWEVAVIPLAWAAIGGSAAIVLDVRADLGLAAAGVVLAAVLVADLLHHHGREHVSMPHAGQGSSCSRRSSRLRYPGRHKKADSSAQGADDDLDEGNR